MQRNQSLRFPSSVHWRGATSLETSVVLFLYSIAWDIIGTGENIRMKVSEAFNRMILLNNWRVFYYAIENIITSRFKIFFLECFDILFIIIRYIFFLQFFSYNFNPFMFIILLFGLSFSLHLSLFHCFLYVFSVEVDRLLPKSIQAVSVTISQKWYGLISILDSVSVCALLTQPIFLAECPTFQFDSANFLTSDKKFSQINEICNISRHITN